MNFFVVGGTGYIGTKIVNRLLDEHHNVWCVNRPSSDISCLQNRQGIEFVPNSLEVIDSLFCANSFDWVLNMACSYAQGTVLYNDVLDANMIFPLTILNIAAKHEVKYFLTIGTGLPDSFNMYSFSKKIFSEFGEFYYKKHNINFCNLKLEMFYGADEPQNRFLPSCIEKMKKNEAIPLTIGTQKRDIIYVDDVCNAIMFVIHKRFAGYHLIPVGTGVGPTIKEIITYIYQLIGSCSDLQFGKVPMRDDEPDSIADISFLKQEGFEAQYSWQAGLKKMLSEENL